MAWVHGRGRRVRAIRMTMEIAAPVERCFQLALSVDLEAEVLAPFGIRPIGGLTHGILGANGTVRWRGRQFGLRRTHTSLIDQLRAPLFFRDVMTEGSFARYGHEHHFATMNDGTFLRDELRFTLPWGPLGRTVDGLVARRLLRMMEARNAAIKQAAEGEGWRTYLER